MKFLNCYRVDYAELVDSVPYIGELLLDDFKMKKHESYDHLNENIKVSSIFILFCFFFF